MQIHCYTQQLWKWRIIMQDTHTNSLLYTTIVKITCNYARYSYKFIVIHCIVCIECLKLILIFLHCILWIMINLCFFKWFWNGTAAIWLTECCPGPVIWSASRIAVIQNGHSLSSNVICHKPAEHKVKILGHWRNPSVQFGPLTISLQRGSVISPCAHIRDLARFWSS